MAFVWDPLALVGVAALVLGWVLAAFVYRSGPGRRANATLALVLVAEATSVGLVRGVAYFTDDGSFVEVGTTKGALFGLTGALLILHAAAYLAFLGTLPTPLVRPLRGRAALVLLAAGTLAAEAWYLSDPFRHPERYGLAFTFLNYVQLLGIACAVDVWRRAPPGTARRAQAAAYALAFLWRDAAWFWYVEGGGGPWFRATFPPLGDLFLHVFPPSITIGFALLLAYGILRTQLFDIDLRVKVGLRRGTVAGAFLLVFLVVAQIGEIWLQQYGVLAGGLAAGLLVFLLAPLQRAAERVANAAMPATTGSPEYLSYRKLQVYRNAFESAREDGLVTDRERAVLASLARDLAIRPEDAAAVEAEAERARPARAADPPAT